MIKLKPLEYARGAHRNDISTTVKKDNGGGEKNMEQWKICKKTYFKTLLPVNGYKQKDR